MNVKEKGKKGGRGGGGRGGGGGGGVNAYQRKQISEKCNTVLYCIARKRKRIGGWREHSKKKMKERKTGRNKIKVKVNREK